MKRNPIGLKDRDGREICEGDIVEYRVDYDSSAPPHPTYDLPEGTRMVDTVKIIDGVAYFWDEDINSGGYAWRHHKHSRVIGNIHDAHNDA